jgi:hypothetical protein
MADDGFMRNLPDEFLICRDRSIGHDWDVDIPFQLSRRMRSGSELIRTSRCTRCTMRRYEFFEHHAARGYIVKLRTRYEPPEGYSDPTSGRVLNADVWVEQLRRIPPLPMPEQEQEPKRKSRTASKLRAVPNAS